MKSANVLFFLFVSTSIFALDRLDLSTFQATTSENIPEGTSEYERIFGVRPEMRNSFVQQIEGRQFVVSFAWGEQSNFWLITKDTKTGTFYYKFNKNKEPGKLLVELDLDNDGLISEDERFWIWY